MAKVYGVHPIQLKPGVSGAEFEQFITGEGAALFQASPGANCIVKGDRGVRAGQYALIVEFDSVEARDAAYPVADVTPDEAATTAPEPVRTLLAKFFTLASGIGEPTTYTDYVVVAE